MNDCIDCGRPLRGDERRICNGCVSAAYTAFEAYQEIPLGTWEGIIPEPDLPTDGDTVAEFKAGFRDILTGNTMSLAELDAYTEGDTQPNATEYDCDYNTATGACFRATIDYCEDCPYRQAIGDVAS